MGVLKTVKYHNHEEDFQFSYTVSVTADGLFTTTLPSDVAVMLKVALISLENNRSGNPGFFSDKTLDALLTQVSSVITEYFSKKLVESKIVIKYTIQTTCSYCLDVDGEIVPNGMPEWVGEDRNGKHGYKWQNGTIGQNATNPHPFGLSVFARASKKEVFQYRSGKTVSKYSYLNSGDIDREEQRYLHHLNSFASMSAPKGENPREIDYTENVARFFVDLLTSICRINEKIKDVLEPDKIAIIAESGQKLLE